MFYFCRACHGEEGGGGRKRNQCEVGKRKNSLRFERRQQKEHEGGVFSTNTHVLRNHSRKEGYGGGETHERVTREGMSVCVCVRSGCADTQRDKAEKWGGKDRKI